jgi:hypothetical protein
VTDFRVVMAAPAGHRANGQPIPARRFVLARPEPEPLGPGRARIFEAVWVPQLARFDHHPHVVLTDTITEVTE